MTKLLAKLVVCLLATGELLLAQQSPSGPPPGVLIDIGGHQLHVRCIGPEVVGPTVILEAGAGDYSTAWSAVQEILSSAVRTCAYDRGGWGWSETGPRPRTMTQEAFELNALLEAANLPGPYVLVGHSYGGLLVRRYTERYGDDIVAVVLVDATHESNRLFYVEEEQWMRVRDQASARAIPEPRGFAPGEPPSVAFGYDPSEDFWGEEFKALYDARTLDPASLGERPLIVLEGTRQDPPPTSDAIWDELRVEGEEHAADLARLSRNSKLIRDPSSGHDLHEENPELVASAIEEVLQAVARGVRLR